MRISHIERKATFQRQGAGGTLRGLQNGIVLYPTYLEIKFIIFKFHMDPLESSIWPSSSPRYRKIGHVSLHISYDVLVVDL